MKRGQKVTKNQKTTAQKITGKPLTEEKFAVYFETLKDLIQSTAKATQNIWRNEEVNVSEAFKENRCRQRTH